MTNEMATVFLNGLMEENMRVTGKTANNMVRVLSPPPTMKSRLVYGIKAKEKNGLKNNVELVGIICPI